MQLVYGHGCGRRSQFPTEGNPLITRLDELGEISWVGLLHGSYFFGVRSEMVLLNGMQSFQRHWRQLLDGQKSRLLAFLQIKESY